MFVWRSEKIKHIQMYGSFCYVDSLNKRKKRRWRNRNPRSKSGILLSCVYNQNDYGDDSIELASADK